MTTRLPSLRRASGAALLSAALSASSFAHEGHDHEPGPASQAPAASEGARRFSAASDLFELVGALDGQRLTIWLDRYADNAPVTGAAIELEVGDRKAVARPEGDRYLAELPQAPAPGTLPVTVTVLAGDESDLLVGELVVPQAQAPAGAALAAPAGAGPGGQPSATDWRSASALLGSALPWVLGAICAIVIVYAIATKMARVEDHQTGRTP